MTLTRIMGVIVVACVLWPSPAPAQESGSVVVLPFSGLRAEQVQERVKWVLRVSGHRLFDETGAPAFNASDSEFAAFAKRWKVSAFIMGQVSSQRNAWGVDLQIRSGHNGKPVDNARLSAPWMPGLLRNVETDLMRTINPALAQASTPEGDVEEVSLDEPSKKGAGAVAVTTGTKKKASKSVKDEDVDDEEAADEDSDDAEAASDDDEDGEAAVADEPARPKRPRANDEPSALSLALDGGYLFRTLNANAGENPAGELTEQSGAFPALTVRAGLYPFGFGGGDGFWTNVGVEGEFETSLGGSESFSIPNSAEPVDVQTSMTGFMVGPRVRFPIRLDLAEIGLSAKFGRQRMALDFAPAAPDPVTGVLPGAPRGLGESDVGGAPDVNYTFLRFAVDGRYRFGRFVALNGAIAYRLVTNPGDQPGEIGSGVNEEGEPSFFPEDQVNGADAALSFDFKLVDNLELRLGGDARLYAHQFNSQQFTNTVGERLPVAGGATDAYYRGTLGVVWTPNL